MKHLQRRPICSMLLDLSNNKLNLNLFIPCLFAYFKPKTLLTLICSRVHRNGFFVHTKKGTSSADARQGFVRLRLRQFRSMNFKYNGMRQCFKVNVVGAFWRMPAVCYNIYSLHFLLRGGAVLCARFKSSGWNTILWLFWYLECNKNSYYRLTLISLYV